MSFLFFPLDQPIKALHIHWKFERKDLLLLLRRLIVISLRHRSHRMAERKRPSTTEKESEPKRMKLIQTKIVASSDRPMCKYGAKCYRKHPDHLKAFRHPSPTKETTDSPVDDEPLVPMAKESEPSSSSSSASATASSTISLLELAELSGEDLLSKVYQMKFPPDFYEFWKFCCNMEKKHPRGWSTTEQKYSNVSNCF